MLQKTDKYYITKRGNLMLQYYSKVLASKLYPKVKSGVYLKDIREQTTPLQVWTEEELEELKKKRKWK